MSFFSPFSDVEIPQTSIYEFLFSDLADKGEHPALVDGSTGAVTSYAQLRGQINALAGGLAARGIKVGEVLALLCPNIPIYVTIFHGALRAGATLTTVNTLYTAREISEQLADSKATHVFTLSMFLPQVDEAAAIAGIPPENVIVIDGDPRRVASRESTIGHGDGGERSIAGSEGGTTGDPRRVASRESTIGHSGEDRTSLRSLLTSGAPAPEVSFDPATHLAVLPYSSGTTGRAKGVMLTHRNLVANIAQFAGVTGVEPDDRVLCVLPFYHIYGMNVLMNGGLHFRSTLITMPKFDLMEFLRIIAEHRASFLYIAPPMAVALAKHPVVEQFDTSSIRILFSGAAPLDGELAHAVQARLGCKVRQGYGMSEMSPVSHAIPGDRDDIPLDSVGLTIPNMECKIVDPATGTEIAVPTEGVSEPGELWCKGPNVMAGYFGNAQATGETLDADGFLHTGDVATVTADGIVTIVDRVKELIKYKGYQVPPAELEALLLTHEKIADAAVIGVKDEDGQEIPKAFVVLQPGAELTAQAVMEFVAERVAPHKKVRAVEFIDIVPKSAAGKILRRQLRAPAG